MKYIEIDEQKNVVGFYPSDYHGQLPDVPLIEVSDEVYHNVLSIMPAIYTGTEFVHKPPIQPTFDELKQNKRQYIAAARYEAETGGCTVDGVMIATDRGSQALLTAAVVMARLDPEFKTQWKCADGCFKQLDAFQLRAIGDAVIAHVERCFAREGELCEQIDAATTPEELDAIRWSL